MNTGDSITLCDMLAISQFVSDIHGANDYILQL